MATMPDLVGLNYRAAIFQLIEAGILPNDGSVPAIDKPPPTVGYFSPWPLGASFTPDVPPGVVSRQYPSRGLPVNVSSQLSAGSGYSPSIALEIGRFPMAVSNLYSFGAYDSNMVASLFAPKGSSSGVVGIGLVGLMIVGLKQ